VKKLFVIVSLVCTVGCTDFDAPSQLQSPVIIAVTSDPPVVGLGKSSTLNVLVAGADGQIESLRPTWKIGVTIPGVPPIGILTSNQDGSATYTAPALLPPLPPMANPLDTVEITVPIDGVEKRALKAMVVADIAAANPVVTSIVVNDKEGSESAVVAAGSTVVLRGSVSPIPDTTAVYAWYSTIGTIEQYTMNPATLLAKEPGQGWIFFVVRDGKLGVGWKKIAVTVQ
jgi:hypothetical protein